ncbi:MAG: hypothetical protein ACJAXY_000921 [Nonlabens sp.]|jgi:hypothetical protein
MLDCEGKYSPYYRYKKDVAWKDRIHNTKIKDEDIAIKKANGTQKWIYYFRTSHG